MTSNGDVVLNPSSSSSSSSISTHPLDDSRKARPPLSPSRRQPPSPKPVKPPSSPSLKDPVSSKPPLQNGVHPTDDAQNESEAETVVLDDATKEERDVENKVVKAERTDDDDAGRMRSLKDAPRAHSPAPNGHGRRKSTSDQRQVKSNGAKNGSDRDKTSPAPASPTSKTASRPARDNSPLEKAKSPTRATTSPSHPATRGRSSSTVESRKRKLGDDARGGLEPPRQRPRTEATTKDSRNQPTSPATPGLGRPHKRSQSTQSAVQGTQPVPGRKRRDPPAFPSRMTEPYESSSESSSPHPLQTPSLQHHTRVKRSSHRAQTSPARSSMPKKNVDKFGATRLARESEKGDLAAVEAAYSAAPEELDQADFAGIAPLQKAALNGYASVVKFLIEKGCRTDCESNDRDTPLIDAVENGHLDVVKLLLDKGRVNPHHQNKKGQRAIDVLDYDHEDSEQIEKELKAAMRKAADTSFSETHDGPNLDGQKSASRLLYNEYNTETLVEKAADGDIIAVGELLNSNIKPNIACGVAAARGGHYDILSILLAHGLKADPDPSKHSETPMLVAIGRGHLKIVDLLLEQDNFDPTRRDRNGKTYYELSEERRGPKWEHERDILKKAFDSWRQSHRSPTRNRKGAPNPSQVRAKRKSSPMREHSLSPQPEAKRSQARSSSGTQPAQKSRGRLMSGREMANQRDAKRRRRVVDEESSSSGSDDEVRAPVKRKQRSLSDSGEHKPKKRLDKVRSGNLDAPKKSERAHSDHNDDERQRRVGKSVEKRIYNNKPPPESESLDERKLTKKISAKVRPGEERPKKRPLEDMSSDEIKVRKTSTTSAMSTPAPPEKASTPDSVRERRQEAERQAAEAKRKAEADARKRDEEEAARKAAEEEQAREREKEQARVKAEAEAEAKRIAEEEERARLAAEAEAKRIREEEAAKHAARRERISKLPLALRLACERGKNRPLHFKGETLGISFCFLPIFYAEAADVDPDRPTHLPRETYVMSFQAVGILGLPEPDLALADAPYCNWPRKPVTQAQRGNLIGKYDVARLAQDQRFPVPGMVGYDGAHIQASIKEARKQLMLMEGLYWIPLNLLRDAVSQDPFLKPLTDRIVDGNAEYRVVGKKKKSAATFMDFLTAKSVDGVKQNGGMEKVQNREQDKEKMDVDMTESVAQEG